MYCGITASGFVSGQQCELYAAYDEVSNTYWKGTYIKDNSTPGGSWTVKLYKNTDLLSTKTMNPIPFYVDYSNWGLGSDTDHVRCWICVDAYGNAKAGINGEGEPAWSIENGGTIGRGAGLGHQNSIGTYLDDFFMAELHDTTHECEACWCSCCGNLLSPRLTATIVVPDTSDRAGCLDGQEVDLLWLWDGGLQHREGTLTYTRTSGGTTYTSTFAMSLACASNGSDPNCTGQNITLTLTANCAQVDSTVCTTGCILNPTTDSTCSPLNLIFGPYEIKSTNLSCSACYTPSIFPPPGVPTTGFYYIVITEAAEVNGVAWADGGIQYWEDDTVREWEV